MNSISTTYHWQRITPDDGHYFFGYYDRNPWNADQSLHLMLKIDQCERLPLPGEKAEVGAVTLTGAWRKFTETRSWCHQQGCMELFHPQKPDCILYNDYDVNTHRLQARILQLGKGEIGRYDRPVYALAPNGKFAVSLDIGRIPRRGYSYADVPVGENLFPADCERDGLFLIDLETGRERLLASYRDMLEQHPFRYSTENRYIWLNHAIVNCDSSRVLWLLRQTSDQYKVPGWQTFMYTCGLDGSDITCVLPDVYWSRGLISHQIWGRTPNEILVDANWDGTGNHAIVLNEAEHPFRARKLADSHGRMAHMVFSPDGTRLLADSYPENGVQTLALIEAETGTMEILGRFNHQPEKPNIPSTRCDLHPRWSPDGHFITVDSIHDGKFRACYLLKV